MKLAFSTLGCPRWGIAEIADAACRLGYDAIELRCLRGDLDLLRRPELRPQALPATRELLLSRGLAICCVDSSACFHACDIEERAANVAAVAHAHLAAALGAPLVRVFPNAVPATATRAETVVRIAAALHDAAIRLPSGVQLALETHGEFATAKDAVEIVERAAHPAIAVVWDVANTIAAGEPIAASLGRLGRHLAHVHLRDARPVRGDPHWKPVLAGRGRVPFGDAIAALRGVGYADAVSFEWEKYWRPDLEEPEIALADFMSAVRRCGAFAELSC